MVHDVQAIRDDLAFMRALAQEGRRTPLLIGQGLIASGVVFGGAALFCWAVQTRVLDLPLWWQGAIWPLAVAVFMPLMRWRRAVCSQRRPGASSVTNRAAGAAMRGMGFALVSLMFASWALAYSLHSLAVFAMFPPVVFAVYGAAWMVAAAMGDLAWLKWVAAGCYAASVVMGFASATAYGDLVLAVLLLAVTTLPGAILVRAEPSTTV